MSDPAKILVSDPPAPGALPKASRFQAGAIGVLLAALAGSAYWQLFTTTLRFLDDEGYVLISLRNFAAGGRLYAEVFSQYGPFYNLLFAGLHRGLGLPLDTASARLITLVTWLACCLGAGVLVHRATRSLAWAAAAIAAIFFHLRLLTHEPLHPVGLIALLLTASAATAAWLLARDRDHAAYRIVAATAVLAALVKINVGLFGVAGLVTIALWRSRSVASRPWARAGLIFLALAAGAVLMRALLHDSWVQIFLLVYLVSAGSTLTVLALDIPATENLRATLRSVVGAALVTLSAVLAIALAAGIGPTQLLDGILRGPLRHPTAFAYPFRWSHLTVPVLAFNLAAFGAWVALRRRASPFADQLVVLCRLIVSAGFLVSFFHGFAVTVEGFLLSFGTGFLWALAAPLATQPTDSTKPRQLLAALALFQVLHAFPVAGTQVNVGTLLLVVLLIVSLADTAAWCAHQGFRRAEKILVATALALPLWGCTQQTMRAARAYFRQPAETFTRAGLHLSPWQTSSLATLDLNTRAHGDMLFSLPGMFSLNLWTQLPTPNAQNITNWWALLDDAQQAEIARRLDVAARPVIIVQRNLITSGLAKSSYRPTSLTRYLEDRFTPLFALDGYEFWVRRGSTAPALGIARWNSPAADGDFTCNFSAAIPATAARAEFIGYRSAGPDHVSLRVAIRVARTPIGAGPFARWECHATPPNGFSRRDCDAVRFFDPADRLLIEARFERPTPQANPS